jgi:hypothetical protein
MGTTLRHAALHTLAAVSVLLAMPARAQDAAGPAGMSPEIGSLFADATAQGGTVTFAPSEQPAAVGMSGAGASVAGTRYLYTTLRVTNTGAKRGCGVSDWNCMTNLCRADLADQSAWRGWAGCWRDGDTFICYFECGQIRSAF